MAILPIFLQAFWLCITLFVSLAASHPAAAGTRATARRSFSLDAVRNPAFARNGPHAYSKALNKYGADLPDDFFDATQIKGAGMIPFPDYELLTKTSANRMLQFQQSDLSLLGTNLSIASTSVLSLLAHLLRW